MEIPTLTVPKRSTLETFVGNPGWPEVFREKWASKDREWLRQKTQKNLFFFTYSGIFNDDLRKVHTC